MSGTLQEAKGYGGYDSSEVWGLIMAGGYDYYSSPTTYSTVETTNNGEVFGSLPDLPDATQDSCVVIVDQDRIFSCGGKDTSSRTLIFQKATNSWNT